MQISHSFPNSDRTVFTYLFLCIIIRIQFLVLLLQNLTEGDFKLVTEVLLLVYQVVYGKFMLQYNLHIFWQRWIAKLIQF